MHGRVLLHLVILSVLIGTALGCQRASATPNEGAIQAVLATPTAESRAAAARPSESLPPLNPPVALKVGTVNSISDAGIFIAMERGYFREQGI